ncbi:MAG: hypothetical protein NVS3B5_06460 [Sphingomicrobium sp.]
MPLPLTHALVPVAGFVAVAQRPISGRLMAIAMIVAMMPDVDGPLSQLIGISHQSIYSHRGFTHSFFIALLFGTMAAAFHRRLRVQPLTAAVVVGAAMASHGLLDMMTNSGRPVAYLWPLSSARLFADWRPIPGSGAQLSSLLGQTVGRIGPDLHYVVAPMFLLAISVRACLWAYIKVRR